METANDTAMHVTETKTLCSSLTCPPSKSEEITKDQEEELLRGNVDDGDVEEALSDDNSMRLRLSDDEVDDPSAKLDVTTKKTAEDDAGMELGSRVPATDSAERKSALITQVLSNGTCADASKDVRVDRDDRTSNGAFPEENDSRYCNGDAAPTEIKSAEGESTTVKQTNKWKFAGQFGEYSSRANRNSQSKYESNKYAADPYNDKYYNKNTYYGNKGSRVHNSYRRESSSPPPSTAAMKQESSEHISSQAIMSERVTTESSNVDSVVSNNVEQHPSESDRRTKESETNEKPNELSIVNSDTSEAIHDSKHPAKVPQDADTLKENSKVHCESGDEAAKSENDEVNVSNESIASAATLVLGDLNDDKDVCDDSETVPASAIGSDSDAKKPDEGVEKIDEDVESAKTDERPVGTISGDDSAMQFEVEKEAGPDGMEAEDSMSPMSGLRSSLERAEMALAAEIENCDNSAKVDEKAQEEKSEKLDSPKAALPVEDAEKSHEGSATDAAAADTEKQPVAKQPEQALTDTSVAATNDGETVEAAVASVEMGASAKPMNFDIEAHIADLPDERETSSEEEGEVHNVRIHTSLKRPSTEMLDEMELSRRMRIRRRKTETDGSAANADANAEAKEESVKAEDAVDETDDNASTVDNPVTNIIADSKSSSETSLISNTVVENSGSESSWKSSDVKPESDNVGENKKVDDCEVIEVPVKKRQKRSRKSLQVAREPFSQEDNQEKENVRQKRRTAKTAEEIIRKELLVNSDSESNDSAGNLVAVNYNKTSNNLRAASPPTLKRNYAEEDEKVESKTIKKLKHTSERNGDVSMKTEAVKAESIKVQTLAHVRKFFRRDSNGKLAKLKQEELEELLIQKVVETITMRDEIGKLREQAKISERNQEATRQRCQQLAKQIKDFEMVLNRYESDRRANPDKTVVPIKINRSVGLQVNFVTEHGIQNMRQLGQIQKTAAPVVNGTSSPQQTDQSTSSAAPIKRTIKVRSPRRSDPPPAPTVTAAQTPTHSQPIMSNVTPAALVVAKSVSESRTQATPTVQQTTTTVPHLIAPKQTILVNGPITSQSIRQATTIQVSKPSSNSSDLIDLTQEEDKTKSTIVPQNAILTTAIAESSPSVSNVQKIAPRYHTVIQTLPANVALAAQSGIRVVQPSSQPTPTALVNNMNAPRLAYVMQSGMGSARQVVVTSAPAPIRPAPTIRSSYPLSGTITNGTVRVIPMTSTATIQVYKHPAALPESLNSPANPSWKLPPPAPSLKISKVANGIVLSWNMALSDKYADIASYQLYAYQEVSGIAPSSSLWKKVGDVRALPLPMACTLTQFSEGNNYYFAVRAVDKHSRLGMYSQPGNISL